MSDFPSHGITESTPSNIVLGAGTIHVGLEYTDSAWNATESLFGATSGGNKLTITPEILDIEADGALVKVEGLAAKIGETATLEVNLLEATAKALQLITLGEKKATSSVTGYDELAGKASIASTDYLSNFGFVGKTLAGKPIIIIFDKALCTSGLKWDAKAKEAGVLPATFECYAPITSVDALPWHIYTPTAGA